MDESIIINVPVIDNNDWEPDMDFSVELYDPDTNKRYLGDDTITKVTIIDEDFPGIIGFEITSLSVSRDQEYLDIMI